MTNLPGGLESLNLHGLSQGEVAVEVAKAFGFGAQTSDMALRTQGGALTATSLEEAIVTMRVEKGSFKRYHEIKSSQAAGFHEVWVEDPLLGGSQGASISNSEGSTKEIAPNYRRRDAWMKFFALTTSINQAMLEQRDFRGNQAMQDEQALTRIVSDHSWMIYEGGVGPDEYNGAYRYASDPDQGNHDGLHVADTMGSGYSGLDGDGYSNPADIELAVRELARVISRPENGKGVSPYVHVGASTYEDLQNYKAFDPIFIQDAGPKGVTTNNVLTGFANPYAGELGDIQATRIQVDPFLPDHANQWDIAPELRVEASTDPAAPRATVTAQVVSDSESRFDARFEGAYEYFVVPAGRRISTRFYHAPASGIAEPIAVPQGSSVRLTITRGLGGNEDLYLVYRGRRNGQGGLADARLMARIPAGGPTTTFVDNNRDLPGATKVYLMDMTNAETLEYRYLMQPMRIELPRNQQRMMNIPVGFIDARYLRSRKPRHIGVLKNYVPRSTYGSWSPLG